MTLYSAITIADDNKFTQGCEFLDIQGQHYVETPVKIFKDEGDIVDQTMKTVCRTLAFVAAHQEISMIELLNRLEAEIPAMRDAVELYLEEHPENDDLVAEA